MPSAIVLLSGGLDSTTLLANTVTAQEPCEAVFVNYGQRHLRERDSSIAVAAHYGVPWMELDLRCFGDSVKSALTSGGLAERAEVPHGHYAADNMALTVVPGRNAVMLSAAAGIAASRGAVRVLFAAHAGDHPIYPDCRLEFITAMSAATEEGYGVRVVAPFAQFDKAWIAERARKLDAPVHLSWSCYEGGEIHCGRCGTCVERAEAFWKAGVPDPTEYVDANYWKTVCLA
jgi:7-cyano-7-deazaguanine synthase